MNDAQQSVSPVPSPTVARVFFPFALGYFLSYLFRVVNAVIAPDLVAELGIGPSELGLLTATYFIAFASSQLPLGICLDRIGPRTVEAFLLVFAGIGALVFAASHSLFGLITGRALIGFGVSACLMAAFKSYVIWFPAHLLSRVNGFQMAAGGMGALAAATPVQWALAVTDWRGIFTGLGLLCFITALAVGFIVPPKRSATRPEAFSLQIKGIAHVFRDAGFWRIAPLATMSQAGYIAIQGLWAGPWLRDVAGLDRTFAAAALSWSAAAMIAGFICLGFLAEKLSEKGFPVVYSAVTGMGVFMGVQAAMTFDLPVPPRVLMGLFGFFGTAGILSYTALTLSFPRHLSGRVTTGINLLVFVAAFVLQWAIGAVIGLWETPGPNAYAKAGYRAGFLMVLLFEIIGFAWFWLAGPRKTR